MIGRLTKAAVGATLLLLALGACASTPAPEPAPEPVAPANGTADWYSLSDEETAAIQEKLRNMPVDDTPTPVAPKRSYRAAGWNVYCSDSTCVARRPGSTPLHWTKP